MYLCDDKETADLKTILNKTFVKRIFIKSNKEKFHLKEFISPNRLHKFCITCIKHEICLINFFVEDNFN